MQVILHLGMPKTGTTALQDALIELNPALRERGILYPLLRTRLPNHNFLSLLTGNERKMNGLFRDFIRKDPDYLTQTIPKAWKDLESQIKEAQPRKLILSAEMLFAALPFEKENPLKEKLQELSTDIRLIAYFRRPSRQYLSAVQQRLKNAYTISPPSPMNVRRHVELWEKSMNCSLTALCYDRDALIGGDITTDFLTRFTSEDERAGLQIPSIRSNETISAEAMEILQEYRHSIYPESDEDRFDDSNALRRALIDLDENDPGTPKPRLINEISDYIDYSSTELLWLRDQHGVTFPEIDYARIGSRPAPALPDAPRVSDICPVDAQRKNVLYARALKKIHDKLAHQLEKRKRRQRSLFGWLR